MDVLSSTNYYRFPRIERRARRSNVAGEAIGMQLQYLVELLNLDAILLADDLGLPISYAGNPQLADLLGQNVMWTTPRGPGIDPLSMSEIEMGFPHLVKEEIISHDLALPGMDSACRVIAAGKSLACGEAVQHAASSIQRIWLTAD